MLVNAVISAFSILAVFVLVWRFFTDRTGLIEDLRVMLSGPVPFLIFGALASAGVVLSARLVIVRRDLDQSERALMSDLQLFERNLKADIISTLSARQVDKLAPKETVTELVNTRIDEALVSGIDEALKKRLDEGAKGVDVIGYIDTVEGRIRTLLDGPAGRAEQMSGKLMALAMILGTVGLVIASLRVFGLDSLGDRLLVLSASLGDKSLWPYIFAMSAPWVTLVGLIEFTALMLLKLSNKLSMEQRQYTELLVEFNDRLLALKAVVRFGNANEVVQASTLLIKHTQSAAPQGESLEQSLSTISKITESLANIGKQFSPKDSN